MDGLQATTKNRFGPAPHAACLAKANTKAALNLTRNRIDNFGLKKVAKHAIISFRKKSVEEKRYKQRRYYQ